MKTVSLILSYILPALYLGVVYLYYQIFTGRHKKLSSRTSLVLAVLALIHLSELVTRHLVLKTMPLSTIHDAFSFLAFSILLVYLIIELSLNNRASGFFILCFAFILELISTINLSWEKETNELLSNPTFAVHASMSIIGYTALSLSALYALMYILQNYNLKKKRIGSLPAQMPPLTYLENMSIRAVVIGIIFLGLGIMHGHFQANKILGSYVPMDIKVIVTDLIWAVYFIGYILSRIYRWRGKWMAYLSISGFSILLIVGVVVMYFADSFHRFF